MINKKIDENGITIITLILTVLILIIITGTLAINTYNSAELSKITMLEDDIRNLRERVSSYYVENGELPINNNVYTKMELQYSIEDLSDNDAGNYYEIDLSKIDNITLNYNTNSDVYIINESSHNIYHLDGILYNGRIYHTVGNNETVVTIRYPYSTKVPKEYQEVEYLESTGTQYIDTNYVVQETDTLELEYKITNLSATGDKFILAAPSSNIGNIWVETYGAQNHWYVRFGSTTSVNVASDETQLEGKLILRKNEFIVNGNKILEPTFNSMPLSSIQLFARNNNGTIIGSYLQIRSFKITNGTSTIMNLIPCYRISDNKPGMYDIVNHIFYTNEGAGEFNTGPITTGITLGEQRNLPIEFKEIEYIESTGTQYIDTGVICDNNSRIKIKFRTPEEIPTNRSTVLFYAGASSTNYGFAIGSYAISGKYRYFYKTTINANEMLQTSTDYTIDFNKENLYINNTLEHTFDAETFTVAYTMPLLGQYYNSNSVISLAPYGTRIYYAQMWDDDTLIRDFIPCYRISDNKPGLYDTVNNEFYTNNGTGEFKIGNNIEKSSFIGKYVDYTPENGTYSLITNNTTYTGTADNTSNFTTETFNWRIWSIEGNKLTLIADDVTKTGGTGNGTLKIRGAVGYNNGVKILNDICKKCYSNSAYGAIGRSMNIADVEKVLNKSVWNSETTYFSANGIRLYNYKDSYRYSTNNKYYPYIHQFEEYSNIDGRKKEKGQGINRNEQEGYYPNSAFNYSVANDYIEPIAALIYRAGSNWSSNNFINNNYYNLIFKNADATEFLSNYYLASRYVNLTGSSTLEYASFGIQHIADGGIIGNLNYSSKNGIQSTSRAVRPMVEINLTKVSLDTTSTTGENVANAYQLVRK